MKSRPPKYKWDIHSKIQHLRGKLHQQQHDEGILEIAVRREHIFEDSAAYLANLDPLTLTRTLHIKYDGKYSHIISLIDKYSSCVIQARQASTTAV